MTPGQLRCEARLIVAAHPSLFYPLMRMRDKYRSVLVGDDTEIVIEGFPRSGNTFAVAAFEFAQGRSVAFARHTHAPAQVLESAKRRLPAVVLLRQPRDAVISLAIREPELALGSAIRRYAWFYEHVWPARVSFVVAPFDEVVSDYSRTIARVNERFGTRFELFEHSEDNVRQVFSRIEDMEREDAGGELRETHVGRPSASRGEVRLQLDDELRSRSLRHDLAHCEALYERFRELA